MDLGVGVLSFRMRDMDAFPGFKFIDLIYQFFAAAPECNKLYALRVQCAKIGIGCKFKSGGQVFV
jgi:hypothetical protein